MSADSAGKGLGPGNRGLFPAFTAAPSHSLPVISHSTCTFGRCHSDWALWLRIHLLWPPQNLADAYVSQLPTSTQRGRLTAILAAMLASISYDRFKMFTVRRVTKEL